MEWKGWKQNEKMKILHQQIFKVLVDFFRVKMIPRCFSSDILSVVVEVGVEAEVEVEVEI